MDNLCSRVRRIDGVENEEVEIVCEEIVRMAFR